MDTQNTPIHVKLWHHDFWRLCFANLLLMSSVYMLIIGIPYFMKTEGYNPVEIALVIGTYGLGIFLLGGFCSYLVQRYRRNRVCQVSILGVVFSVSILYYLEVFWNLRFGIEVLVAARLLLGAFLGLAQMSLASTLVIDSCESFQRTEANYITSWFSRLAIAVGPLIALMIKDLFGMKLVFPVASALALGAFVLVSLAKFPFKAPAEHLPLVSCDRFFLPQGFPLFVNVVLIMISAGMFLSIPHTASVFLMILGGMVFAVFAERIAFADANLKSEAIAGLVLLACSQLVSFSGQQFALEVIVPLIYGFSVGIMGSRFLLFNIKLAKHCQRGTSVSSFFLSWELGWSLGIALGFCLLDKVGFASFNVDFPILNPVNADVLHVAIALTVVSLVFYNFVVHPWYMKHRNR